MLDGIRFENMFLPVEVYVCFNERGYKKLCKNKGYIIESQYLTKDAMTRVCREPGKDDVIVMCFDVDVLKKLDKCVAAGVVVHEATHTLAYICEAIGQDDRKDNEWEAYLIQQMVIDILQFVYDEEK